MTLDLTRLTELLSGGTLIEPQIILEIEDITDIFGAIPVTKIWKVGDPDRTVGETGLKIGGVVEHENSKDYITLDGTSTNYNQQFEPDKQSSASVPAMTVKMIDKDQYLSNLFSPGQVVDDILSKKAQIYLTFANASHPRDSLLILSGVVDGVYFGAGFVELKVAHPSQLQRQEIFQEVKTTLNGAITSGDTSITLTSTTGLISPQDVIKSYIRIEDEWIEYAGISSSTLTGCTRGALGTIAAAHDNGEDVSSGYRLQEDAINLTLKLLLSNGGDHFATGISSTRFITLDAYNTISNAIYFTNDDIVSEYGLTVGDFVTISGATNGANNFSNRAITDFGTLSSGSYIVVNGAALVAEVDSSAVASFGSQYNTLPIGACAQFLTPEHVDVDRFQELETVHSAAFFDYDLFIASSVQIKDLIEREIYFPTGLYPLNRKGKISVGFTSPPIQLEESPVIGFDQVKNPDKLKIGRSTNKFLYNAVIYKYQVDYLEDKFLAGTITTNVDSTTRIMVGNKPLTIESKGIRKSPDPTTSINRISRRYLDRYKFAAESLDVEVMFGDGFQIEPGDVILFGDSDLQITDITQGNRNFNARLMEVIGKDLNIKNGNIRITMLDSAYEIGGRFGVVSPSSTISSGATTTSLPLAQSYGWDSEEYKKWTNYIGMTVKVHNSTHSISGTSVFAGFSPAQRNTMLLSTALGFTPTAGYIVEPVDYPTSTDSTQENVWKKLHCFITQIVSVTSGTSSTIFNVGAGDIGKFSVGDYITVNTANFSQYSEDVKITDITGTQITVGTSLGFTPSASHYVNHVSFADGGDPYIII